MRVTSIIERLVVGAVGAAILAALLPPAGPSYETVAVAAGEMCGADLVQSKPDDLRKQIDRLQNAIAKDEQAIKGLNFAKDADFKQWLDLADDAQKQLRQEAISQALDLPLQAAGVAATAHWDPGGAEEIINDLHNSGVDSPGLSDAIRAFGKGADVKGQGYAYLVNKLSERVSNAKDMIMAGDPNSIETKLQLLAKGVDTLGGMTGLYKSPMLHLFVSEVQLTTAAGYSAAAGNIALDRIEDLSTANADQLKRLSQMNCKLTKDVKTLKAAQQRLNMLNAQAKPSNNSSGNGNASSASSGGAGVGTAIGVGAGVAAAAVSGVAIAKAIQQSTAPDCSSFQATANSKLSAFQSTLVPLEICAATPRANCTSQENAVNSSISSLLNTLGGWCICMGQSAELSASDKAAVQDAFSQLRSLGINPGTLPSCFQ